MIGFDDTEFVIVNKRKSFFPFPFLMYAMFDMQAYMYRWHKSMDVQQPTQTYRG